MSTVLVSFSVACRSLMVTEHGCGLWCSMQGSNALYNACFVFTWEYMDDYMHVSVQCVFCCVQCVCTMCGVVQSVCSVWCVSRVCCGVCRVLICGCKMVAEPAWQCMAMQGVCV